MKALEILKRLRNSDYFDRSKIGLGKEFTLDEAIAELEALQVCDERCEHYHSDNGNFPLLCGECSRFYFDKWRAKV